MKLKDVGEFEAIKLLTEIVSRGRSVVRSSSPSGFQLLVDAGDDTAAWRSGGGTELYTTDTVVEGVHFTKDTIPWHDLGWKIIAANVSDIASMGGLPLYALITLGLPPDTDMAELETLYRGMVEAGNEYGVAIVGGDMVRSPTIFVTAGLTGVCDGDPMLRSTASPGDLVAVTGYLGSSAGGLHIMLNHLPVREGAAEYLKASHRRPDACISQGLALSGQGVQTAMDISDGLVSDLSKLCKASGVAATLRTQDIPVHPALREAFPQRYMDMALAGGEDYQLLFTAPGELMRRVLPVLPPTATIIGEIVRGEVGQVTVVDSNTGESLSIPRGGWDHFSPALSEAEG